MDISFGNIIKDSFDWMVNVLFKTFNLRKWIALTFIAIMAGYLSFNMNLNFPGNKTNDNAVRSCPSAGMIFQPSGFAEADESTEVMPALLEQEPLESQSSINESKGIFNEAAGYIVVSIVGVIFLFIMVIFTWLSSRFRFIFIEDIIKNDGSIKLPWANNKFIGNKLFLFYLFYGIAYLGFLGLIIFRGYVSLKAVGVFNQNADVKFFKAAGSVMPHIALCILLLLAAGLIYFFVENLVTPIMYKKKQAFISSWNEAGALLKKNIGNCAAFFFISCGLGIAAAIATGLIVLIFVIVVMLLGALLFMLAMGILSLLPLGLKVVVGFIFGLIGIAAVICAYFIANMLLLPIAVFFRILGLKFIAALDKAYDIFSKDNLLVTDSG